MSTLSLIYLLLFLVCVPLLAIRSHRAILQGHPLPSRAQLFVQIIVMQALLGAFSLQVAREYDIPIFVRFEWRWAALAAAALVLLAMLATIPLRWRKLSEEQRRRLMLTRPRNAREMGAWVVISAAAGISEEISYRGVLFSVLWFFTGSPWTAALVSAAGFAAGHALQGWRAGVLIFLFALAAQGIVWLAGSLYIAMALHFIYDVGAGFVYMRLCRETQPGAAPPAA